MAISKKPGVDVNGLQPEMLFALMVAQGVYQEEFANDLVITSALEGPHMDGSLHFQGLAIDLRIWDLKCPELAVEKLRNRLNDGYDVVLEDTHIHIEFDPDE